MKFLKEYCWDEKVEKFNVRNLRIMGLLMCNGDPDETTEELFCCIDDSGKTEIACNDKDMAPVLKRLFDTATIIVFDAEEKFLG